jgi:hypothetical protein
MEEDLLLHAVEDLRSACPPEPIESEADRPAPALLVGRRDAIVAAARQLSRALLLAPPLVPLQLEVLLRQTVHLLSVVRAWAESGTAEAAVGATLCCVRRLLRVRLLHPDSASASDVSFGKLLSSPSARPAACELLSTLLVAASDSRANRLRASCVRAVWRLLLLPFDREVTAYVLPGVATQLAEIGSNSAHSHAPTCLAALGAMRVLLCMSLEDGEGGVMTDGAHGRGAMEAEQAAEGLKRLQQMAAATRAASSGGSVGGVGANRFGAANSAVNAGAPSPRQADLPPHARFIVQTRDAGWLELSAQRLSPLLLRLGRACAASTRVRVRMRLVLLLDDISRRISRRALKPCAPTIVELLAGSARDDVPAVATASKSALVALAGRLPAGAQMGGMLAASFERQLASLPRIVQAAAEPPKARAFQLLASQLDLLAISGAPQAAAPQPTGAQATNGGIRAGGTDVNVGVAADVGFPREQLKRHGVTPQPTGAQASSGVRLAAAAQPANDQDIKGGNRATSTSSNVSSTEVGFPRIDLGHLLASRLSHICNTLFAVLRFAPRSTAIEQRIGTHAVRLASTASARRRLEQLRSPAGLLHPFLYLKDAPTVEAVRALCETLGSVPSVVPLVHQILPVICSTVEAGSMPRREAAWLLSRALVGAARGIDPFLARVEGEVGMRSGLEKGNGISNPQHYMEGWVSDGGDVGLGVHGAVSNGGGDLGSGMHGAADVHGAADMDLATDVHGAANMHNAANKHRATVKHGAADVYEDTDVRLRDDTGADEQQNASDVEPETLPREVLLLGHAASLGREGGGAEQGIKARGRGTLSDAFLGEPAADQMSRSAAVTGATAEAKTALSMGHLSAAEAGALEECVLMLLREIVSPPVYERRAGARETLPVGEQHALLQEQWLLLELVGSCFELLGAVARVTAQDAVHAHNGRDRSGAAPATLFSAPRGIAATSGAPRGIASSPGAPRRIASPPGAPRGIAASESLQVAVRVCLLPVLERLGDDAAITSEAAERTLCRMVLAHQDGTDVKAVPMNEAQHHSIPRCEQSSTGRQGVASTAPHDTCPVPGEHSSAGMEWETPTAPGDSRQGPSSVRELLARNGDFLLDAISRQLRHAAAHPRVPLVLEALLTYAAVETLPLLSDVVGDIIGLVDDAIDDVSGWGGPGARAVATSAHDGRVHAGPALLACARAMRAVVVAAAECQQAEQTEGGQGGASCALGMNEGGPGAAVVGAQGDADSAPAMGESGPGAALVEEEDAEAEAFAAGVFSNALVGIGCNKPSSAVCANGEAHASLCSACPKQGGGGELGSGSADCSNSEAHAADNNAMPKREGGGELGTGTALGSHSEVHDPHNGAGLEQGGAGELCTFFDSLFGDVAPSSCVPGSGAAGSGDTAGASRPRDEEEVDEELEKAKQDAEIRAEEEEEIARNTPPLVPGLALRVVAKLEMLLLCAPAAACHVLLDALMAAIPLLSPWPRALLPVLHTLWAPLTQLLHANDLTLSAKAMHALTTAASILCTEVSSTSVKAVFPPLLSALRAHGSIAAIEPAYVRATGAAAVAPRSRQQDALLGALRLLRALCRIPRAAAPRAASILCELEPLLSSRQPERVRTEAVTLGKDLATLQRDAVWLFCARVTPPARLERPPLPQLRKLSTAGMRGLPGPFAEFAASAAELLVHVESEDRREFRRLGLAGVDSSTATYGASV